MAVAVVEEAAVAAVAARHLELRLPARELCKLFLGIKRIVFGTTKAMPDGRIRV